MRNRVFKSSIKKTLASALSLAVVLSSSGLLQAQSMIEGNPGLTAKGAVEGPAIISNVPNLNASSLNLLQDPALVSGSSALDASVTQGLNGTLGALNLAPGLHIISAHVAVPAVPQIKISPEIQEQLRATLRASRKGPLRSIGATLKRNLAFKINAIRNSVETLFDNKSRRTASTLESPSYASAGQRMGFRKTEKTDLSLNPPPTYPKRTGDGRAQDELVIPVAGLHPSSSGKDFIRPSPLPGNPKTGAQIQAAIQNLIADNPGLFNNLKPENFVVAENFKKEKDGDILDMYYINFALKLSDLLVDGALLRFQVQIVDGNAMLVGLQHPDYPPTDLDPNGSLTDAEIKAKIKEKLGFPPESFPTHTSYSRRILPWNGKWHVADVFYLGGANRPSRMVAVDVNDPKEPAYVWDPHSYLNPNSHNPMQVLPADSDREGVAEGNGVLDGPIEDLNKLDVLPLAHVEITNVDTKETFKADENGKFVVKGPAGQKVHLRFRLTNHAVDVHDARGENKNLVFDGVFEAGQELRAVINKAGLDKESVAQVNGYFHTTLFNHFVESFFGFKLRQIRHNVNIDDDCNAFYDGTINTFLESKNCANTTYDDVLYHELGHFLDDSAGMRLILNLIGKTFFAIVNGGLSEGIGDMMALTIISQRLGRPMPTLGRRFLKSGGVKDYVRDARNKHAYNPTEEVHEQGLVFGGVVYKLLINLTERFLREAIQELSLPDKEAAIKDVISLFRTDESVKVDIIYQKLDAKLKELGAEFEKAFNAAFKKAWEINTNLCVPVIFAKPSDIPAAVQQIVLRSIGKDGNSPYFQEIKAAAAEHKVKVTLPRKFGEQAPGSQWVTINQWAANAAHRLH